jgi:pimeloyl-ACP methyl ester carboxylesterase
VNANTKYAHTPSGRIGYIETGSGPVALFVHGVLMNKHLWRHQMQELADIRRCIAVDLLAHGDTDTDPTKTSQSRPTLRCSRSFSTRCKSIRQT